MSIAGRNVEPADVSVGRSDDQHDRVILGDPVLGPALFADSKDCSVVSLPVLQVRVATLQLKIDAFSAGVTGVIFEFDFAIDAVVRIRHRAEYLTGFARDRKRMANQNQFAAFVVDGLFRRFAQQTDFLAKLFRRQLLLDDVPQFDFRATFATGAVDHRAFAVFFDGVPDFVVVQKNFAAFRAGVVSGAFDRGRLFGDVFMDVAAEVGRLLRLLPLRPCTLD